MRADGCAVVQQALATEAAGVVRQAVSLARRRGHAQVTPLHVASAMLSAAGLLRAACLHSHSHPLQCKALELCFNVALNRLPTTGPAAAAMFHGHIHHGGAAHHHHHRAPALSNALVAAFKRAHAHQRRGGTEQQLAAPALVFAAQVELGQLIISILDDPSVSRVMREAGFSSSQVKANVEKAMSSSPDDAANTTTTGSPNSGSHARQPKARADDGAMLVLDCMAGGTKRFVVVVGEGAEAAVKAVMDRVSKAELHHHRHEERLKNIQFVPLSVASFQGMAREEVDAKAGDLRALVREGRAAGKGIVLVLEDLAYAAEAWAAASDKRREQQQQQCYCPVEHVVMEVSSLVSGSGAGTGDRFWLLGFGSPPVLRRCRAGQPSLEAVWELHPVVVPVDGGLALSLTCSSEAAQASQQTRSRTTWPFVNGAAAGESEISCYPETATPASIPSWLRRYQDPNLTSCGTNLQLQTCARVLQDLWNPARNNGSVRQHTSELKLSFSPTSPAASSLSAGYTNCYNTNPMMSSEPRLPWPPKHGHVDGPVVMADAHDYHHQLHATNPSPESISASTNSSDGGGGDTAPERRPKFSELTAENLKILCDTLEDRVPRHKDVATDVASAVLRRRSGMARRRETPSSATWLLFQGRDGEGKKAMALELAKLVFGSYAEFTSISATDFAPIHSGSSSGKLTGKRQRSQGNDHGYAQMLYNTMRENPRRVVMIDDVEQLDHGSEIGIKTAIANGRIRGCNGDDISLEDAIIVLSYEAFDSSSRASSPRVKQRVISNDSDEEDGGGVEKGVKSPCFSLDLNACAGDGEGEEESLLDDVEISDVVDGVFFFRLTGDLSH